MTELNKFGTECVCDRYETCAKCAPVAKYEERIVPKILEQMHEERLSYAYPRVSGAEVPFVKGPPWPPVPPELLAEAKAQIAPWPTARDKVAAMIAQEAAAPDAPRRLIEGGSEYRKDFPMCTGLMDYFPDALAAVANVSKQGNDKHNPGEPMHHARGKSMDHADCIMRHLQERGGFDGTIRHSAALAWRALALLQEELENEEGLSLPRGAK